MTISFIVLKKIDEFDSENKKKINKKTPKNATWYHLEIKPFF